VSAPKVGDKAPEFTLAGTDGTPEGHRDYKLTELAGRPAVLVFYPGDNTPVCTRQLNSYTADIDQFREVAATVWAISP
jgi:thioredoxin-dependent peroxiredoxin